MEEILRQVQDILKFFLNKAILVLSIVLGWFLSAIGYPKEILMFILVLIIIDLITKQYALVKKNYKEFSMKNYCAAWKVKILTSRDLKNGICIKVFLYSPVLYIANQCDIINGIIGGKAISSILYTLLILVEISSVFENFIEAGNVIFIPFMKALQKKTKELIGENEKTIDK